MCKVLNSLIRAVGILSPKMDDVNTQGRSFHHSTVVTQCSSNDIMLPLWYIQACV